MATKTSGNTSSKTNNETWNIHTQQQKAHNTGKRYGKQNGTHANNYMKIGKTEQ